MNIKIIYLDNKEEIDKSWKVLTWSVFEVDKIREYSIDETDKLLVFHQAGRCFMFPIKISCEVAVIYHNNSSVSVAVST